MPNAVARSHPYPRNKGKSRAKPEDEKITAAMPLGKQLAHTDKKVRDRAVQSLVAFLSRGDQSIEEDDGGESSRFTALSKDEVDKLWKGLFYCFWMSDKPLIQQSLASDLAELLLLINPATPSTQNYEEARFSAAIGFLKGFWEAIVREWNGVDRLRQDKFYMLMRKYVNATFRLLAREGWSQSALGEVNGILGADSGPLSWRNRQVPTSLAMHLADLYLDELDKVLALPEISAQPPCPLIPLLDPFISLLCNTPTKTVHLRLMDTLFAPLFSSLSTASSSTSDGLSKASTMYAHIVLGCCITSSAEATTDDARKRAGPVALKKAVLSRMLEVASAEGGVESNRRRIYALWREEGGDEDEDEDDE